MTLRCVKFPSLRVKFSLQFDSPDSHSNRVKPSLKEISRELHSFIYYSSRNILFAQTYADLEPKWNERMTKLRRYGLTQQPIVIAIGTIENITAAYIAINENQYESPTILDAVDRCFKSFFALNAEYPSDSKPVWEFIQRIYGIDFPKRQKISPDALLVWKSIHE